MFELQCSIILVSRIAVSSQHYRSNDFLNAADITGGPNGTLAVKTLRDVSKDEELSVS